MITFAALLAGTLCSFVLVAGPFADSPESVVTGALLTGFAVGWVLLWRLTRQRWALVPATGLGVAGVALVALAPDTETMDALGWVWPAGLLVLVAWMAGRRPTRSRWVLYPAFAVMALVGAGGAFETIGAAAQDDGRAPAGHRLVDVGGHRLDVWCVGSGSPTVVLMPGLGESAGTMAEWIEPQVGATTRVCSFDAAGHGRSDAAPGADDLRDLHELLARVGARGPVVLAGHSLGGLHALSYTRRYPAQVAGVVLLDSMHPRQHTDFGGADPALAVLPSIARTGLARLLLDADDGPPVEQTRQLVRDIEAMPAEQDDAARLRTLGDRPLAVITADKGGADGWMDDQKQLAALSTDATHVVVAGSTHGSLVTERADAGQSADAIRDVVLAVRADGSAR
jgi:pimeloyl-ACP methyl ester carboxylesterase